ncbi:DUF433 domain-containing protein [Halorubrum sp. GN11_10-6_MGM]|uniref:DUF433 domain-containing protein n=1 Tax=Halorubrum sp. GN11_10-6_MGM TaxID=2518112 RepID=UPI0018EEB07F|nr:DUF433 domain-containing protein [Halorubrum sp. GN11_10-6_MGM]
MSGITATDELVYMVEIVSTEDVLGGEPRIAGTRIGILDVCDLTAGEHAPANVADQLDRTLGEVHAALAYSTGWAIASKRFTVSERSDRRR